MSRLAELLGHDHPLFVANVAAMEKSAGNAGIDIKLIADITRAGHDTMRQLGLDTADTTPDELFQALNSAVKAGRGDLFFDTKYVIVNVGGEAISLNEKDIQSNIDQDRYFNERSLEHARRQLRSELIKRYADHERTNNKTINNLAREAGLQLDKDSDDSSVKEDRNLKNTNAPLVLCIGDIVTNAFIKLSEDYAESYTDDKGYKRLSFELGAKLPYDEVEIVKSVECSPNAAVSMSRIGLRTSLMSWLGDDEAGRGMRTYLNDQAVDTRNLVVERGVKSNYHYVLRYGADRTKFQKFEDYAYHWKEPVEKPDWIYLGVLGEKTWLLHEAILDYLDKNPEIRLAFQPGMYHLMWGAEKMNAFYQRAEVVVLNREEAAQVTGKDRADIKVLLQAMHDLGVNVPIITDGADGAYASDGKSQYKMPNYPDIAPPVDRTGAGDAFASTLVAALALGHSLDVAMTWAPINSMNVLQHLGAQAGLQTLPQIEEWLKKAPSDYKPQPIE